jgi:peptidoglycan/LPS O-acetylase OafA/YrhL
MVLVGHLIGHRAIELVPRLSPMAEGALSFFVANGPGGVRVFFVLSGFLITLLIFNEKERTGALSVRGFYMRRILRIWPLYFVMLFVGFVVVPFAGRLAHTSDMTPKEHFWPYAFFLGNVETLATKLIAVPSDVLNPTWSISIEEQFYVVWPLLMAWSTRRWAPGIVALPVALGFAGFALYWGQQDQTYFLTLPNLLPMGIGAGAAYLHTFRRDRVDAALDAGGHGGFRVCLALLLLLACVLFFDRSSPSMLTQTLAVSVAVAGLILEGFTGKPRGMRLERARWLVWLGKYTYSLYLVHTSVELATRVISKRLGMPTTGWPTIALGVFEGFVAIGLAVATYRWIEKPFLSLKDRFSINGHGPSGAGAKTA